MINAGQLKNKVKLYQRLITQDTAGQPNEQYIFIMHLHAKIEPLVGRDYEAAQQIVSEVTHNITTRYYDVIKAHQELRLDTRVFEIISVLDPDEGKAWLYLKCKEVGTR